MYNNKTNNVEIGSIHCYYAFKEIKMQPDLKVVSSSANDDTYELPQKLKHFIGSQKGTMAPGDRVSVDTPMNMVQRTLHRKDIIKWIEKHKGVDWNLFGYVTVVQFPNGTREMINGQHRTELVKIVLPDQQEVPAHIIHIDDQDYAAKLFAAMNGGSSRKLTTEELFWSEVIGKEPYALYVKQQLEKMDLACGKVNEGATRKQVKYPNLVKCLKMGEDATAVAASLIDSAYPDKGIDDQVFSGLTRLLSLKEYEDYGDNETILGKQFEEWFTGSLADTHRLTELRFNQYKNTSQWYVGVAYGLAQKFAHYQRQKNRKAVSIKLIKDIYEAGIARNDNDDD